VIATGTEHTADPQTTTSTDPPPASGQALEEMLRLARRLRMPYLRQHAPDVLATARAQRWDPAEVLRVLLAEEITGRDEATIRLRRKKANFPAGKTFETWDERASSIPAASQQVLRALEWVDRHENLCVCGPSGTRKSHFCEALGQAAVDSGRTVAWFAIDEPAPG
jgi:DNA replication protein DnaC